MRGSGFAIAMVLSFAACRPAPTERLRRPVPNHPDDVVELGKQIVAGDLILPSDIALAPVPAYHPQTWPMPSDEASAPPEPPPVPPVAPRAVVPPRALMSPALARGERLRALAKWRGAIKAYDEVLAAPPSSESTYARYRKAQVLLASGDREGARALFEYLAGTQSPERLASLFDLAEMYVGDGDTTGAEARLARLAPARVAELQPWLLAAVERAGDNVTAGGLALELARADASNSCAYAWHATRLDDVDAFDAAMLCPDIVPLQDLARANDARRMRAAHQRQIERGKAENALTTRAAGLGFDGEAWREIAREASTSELRAVAYQNLGETLLRDLIGHARSSTSNDWMMLAEVYAQAYDAMPGESGPTLTALGERQLVTLFNAARLARAEGTLGGPIGTRIAIALRRLRDPRAEELLTMIESGELSSGVPPR